MPRETNTQRRFKIFAVFIGIVLITIIGFLVLVGILSTDGDDGLYLALAILISLQLSFLTAYILCKSKT